MKRTKMLRAVTLAAALLLTLSAKAAPVATQAGQVAGTLSADGAVAIFKGIPFAAPPVGDLRWRAPLPARPWQGVRTAERFGPICPQMQRENPVAVSEDCLTLNVWEPTAAEGEHHPVLVWIYGGRFSFGAGSEPLYDGEALARQGIVVVTFNYRVGVFGFLATPELSAESGHNASGNYGLLDQIAALHWVHDNIAAFGGDPGKVTIAGQSAGAGSVIMLSNSPLARGLFRAGIAQSGARYPGDPELRGLATSWRPLKDAEAAGQKFAEQHGASTLAKWRGLSWQDVLKGSNLNDETVYGRPPLFRPAVDGWVVPYGYGETWRKGLQSDVTFVTGNNRDESGAEPQPSITLKAYQDQAQAKYGAFATEFLKLYPASSDAQAGQAANAAARDSSAVSTLMFTEMWRQSAHHPVYTYYWDHAPPGPEQARRGAYHGSEIAYAFGHLTPADLSWTPQDNDIAATMSSYWVNIVKNGDPNGEGAPHWGAVEPGAATVMELGDHFGPIPVASPDKIVFWRKFFEAQEKW